MRIISGKLGGRVFIAPKNHRTHPMADKVRGALFSVLGDIDGLTILDAFTGSGALAFEAISRGAMFVVAIDIDKNAFDAVQRNVKDLGITSEKIKVIRSNCASWSQKNSDTKFNIVIAAPPYDDLQVDKIKSLTRHLEDSGVFILDWPGKLALPSIDNLKLIKSKKYVDAQLAFYRKIR